MALVSVALNFRSTLKWYFFFIQSMQQHLFGCEVMEICFVLKLLLKLNIEYCQMNFSSVYVEKYAFAINSFNNNLS